MTTSTRYTADQLNHISSDHAAADEMLLARIAEAVGGEVVHIRGIDEDVVQVPGKREGYIRVIADSNGVLEIKHVRARCTVQVQLETAGIIAVSCPEQAIYSSVEQARRCDWSDIYAAETGA